MDIIDHKYDDDVVLQKRWWYFPTKVYWQSENGRISNLVQLPSFEQLAVGKSAWGNYSATDEQSSQPGQNYPLSQSPVSQLSHRANSCTSCLHNLHMSRLKVWHNLANHHLNRAFLKDTLKKDLVCPELVDFSFAARKGAPVVRKIPIGFNLVVVCLFSGSGRHSDLLTIDRRPSWSQRLFNPVLVSSPW